MTIETDDVVIEHQEVAEALQEEETKPKYRSAREEKLARIAANRAESQGVEPATWGDDDVKPETKPEEVSNEEEAESVAEEQELEQEILPESIEDAEKVELQQKLDELQKREEKLLAELEQRNKRDPQPEKIIEAEPKPEPINLDQQFAEAVTMGDSDAIIALQQQRERELEQRLMNKFRSETEDERVTREFKSKYEDIANDPNLYLMAQHQVSERLQKGESLSDAANAVGDQMTEWLASLKGGPVEEPSKADDEVKSEVVDSSGDKQVRQDLKRETVIEFPTTTAKTEVPKDDTPSRSEIIAQMKRARGQAS